MIFIKFFIRELKDMGSNIDWFFIFLMSIILNIILISILIYE